jgi:glycosyltransferase involved in cell wall biosynthesis
MWETTLIPASFRSNLDCFHSVLVPSEHNAEMFGQYHENVIHVPLGVDTDKWKPTPRKDGKFTFLSLANSQRKGNDLPVRAFERVFGKGDNKVQLVMLDPRGHIRPREGMVLVNAMVEESEVIAHYENAHCYLAPSRGEGFGLQPLQAMAQGIPTILTAAHGQIQFSDLAIGISAGFSQSFGFVHGEAGQWWEPSLDELCERMRDVYDHYDTHLQRAQENALVVRDKWSWRPATEKLIAALGDLDGEWIDATEELRPVERKYLVRVNREIKCHIGGVDFRFVPGTDRYEVPDVKRVLYDAGYLDDSCWDPTEIGIVRTLESFEGAKV